MKKLICRCVLGFFAVASLGFFAAVVYPQAYPYPQNYTLDQRRFDQQQASNLVMRKLQASTTGQWAIGVVDVNAPAGLLISTASYGLATGTSTLLSPPYSVKRFSLVPVGGDATISTNKTDGVLFLEDGLGYREEFDVAVSSLTISISLSSGVCHYAISGGK